MLKSLMLQMERISVILHFGKCENLKKKNIKRGMIFSEWRRFVFRDKFPEEQFISPLAKQRRNGRGGGTTIKKTRKFKKIFFSFAFSSALLCVCAFPPLLLSTSAKFEGKVLVLKSVHHNNEDIDV